MQDLRQMRLRRGLSQADLSGITGVSEFTISELEAGKRPNPRPSTLRKLAQGLNVNVEDLSAYPSDDNPEDKLERLAVKYDIAKGYIITVAVRLLDEEEFRRYIRVDSEEFIKFFASRCKEEPVEDTRQ